MRDERGQAGVVAVVAAGLTIVLVFVLIYFLVFATAGTRGKIAAHNTARNGENTAFNYNYFHDTCNAIKAETAQIKTQQQAYDQQVAADKTANDPFGQNASTERQLLNDLTGLKNVRDANAADYNAKSAEPLTHSYIKDSHLPDRIGDGTDNPYETLNCEQGVSQ